MLLLRAFASLLLGMNVVQNNRLRLGASSSYSSQRSTWGHFGGSNMSV
jgi:hypothetical protein